MPSMRLFSLAALALVAAPLATPAEEPLFFLLTGKDLSCLKAHAADYAPQGDKTSFITLADCGTAAAGSGSLLDQMLNSAPDIESPDIAPGVEGPDAVVALSAQDFACIARLDIPEDDTLLAFYPGTCNVEARN